MDETYAFIGLGAMGFAMAGRIRKCLPKEISMNVYDVHQPSCERFQADFREFGPIKVVDSAKEAANGAVVLVSIIPNSESVRTVFLDEKAGVIAANANPRRLILECSTIEQEAACDVANIMKMKGAGIYIDSPVSGGVPAAETGTLSFLLGCNRDDVRRENPLLEDVLHMMGRKDRLFWCGFTGAGLAAKIANNYISCSVLLVIAEAMAIGVRSGIDPVLLQQVIHNSTGQTFMGDNVNPVPGVVPHAPSSNNWRLGFKTQMMVKDISLGIEAAKRVGIEPRMAIAAVDIWKKASVDERCIDRDGSSVWLHINNVRE